MVCMPYGPCGLSERTGGSRCAGPPPITAALLEGAGFALRPRTLHAGTRSKRVPKCNSRVKHHCHKPDTERGTLLHARPSFQLMWEAKWQCTRLSKFQWRHEAARYSVVELHTHS